MRFDRPNQQKINILGTEWIISVENISDKFEQRYAEAYTDNSIKKMFIAIRDAEPDDCENIINIRKQYARHEIIHAFFYECGLGTNTNGDSAWAINEEMVDWWALNFHKVEKVFKELKI